MSRPGASMLWWASARRHYGVGEMPGWRNQVWNAGRRPRPDKNPRVIDQAYRESNQYLKQHILQPLERAMELSPEDAKLPAELALWYREQWSLDPEHDDLARKAIEMARKVQTLDPESREGFSLESSLQTGTSGTVAQECRRVSPTARASHCRRRSTAIRRKPAYITNSRNSSLPFQTTPAAKERQLAHSN